MSLKSKAIKGFSWTLFEGIFSQGILFLIGIILARLLEPKDFGIIGIIISFTSMASLIVEGGFTDALIRKTNSSSRDYNTIFYTNLVVSFVLYLIIFFTAPHIALYFVEPQLTLLLRVCGTLLFFNALSLIQYILLIKALNFKTKSLIAVASSLISGILAILLAIYDYGIWSLVALSICRPFFNCLFLWSLRNWKPEVVFSKEAFKELFGFGSKLLIAKLISSIYKNSYYVIIGKFFSPIALGYYTRADQFQAPFSSNIARAVSSISFPIMSQFKDNNATMRPMFLKFLVFGILINMTILTFIAGMAESIVLMTVGEKWIESIDLLKLLCVPGMLYPIQIINIELLSIKGYSNLLLRIEIIKKSILIPLVVITAFYSLEIVLYGMICFAIIEFFINSFFTQKLIGITTKKQISSIVPILVICAFIYGIQTLIAIFDLNIYMKACLQFMAGSIILISCHELIKMDAYLEIKQQIRSKLNLLK